MIKTPILSGFFMLMDNITQFNLVKSLHLIFMVSWFAALFYMPRLLIYFVESRDRPQEAKNILQKQYLIMQSRLWYIIGWPAMILTLTFGVWMLVLLPTFLQMPWMHLKLSFVVLLIFYHLLTHNFHVKQKKDKLKLTSLKLRMWNEVATLLLIAIIFTVVFRDGLSWVYGVVGIISIALILTFAIKRYKKWREINK